MFSGNLSPLHHYKTLLAHMKYRGTCTSLHRYILEDKHSLDISSYKILAYCENAYCARIVKKILVQYGKKYKLITNLTVFAPYNLYSDVGLKHICKMIKENLDPDKLEEDILSDIECFIIHPKEGGPRGNWRLHFDHIFKAIEIANMEDIDYDEDIDNDEDWDFFLTYAKFD